MEPMAVGTNVNERDAEDSKNSKVFLWVLKHQLTDTVIGIVKTEFPARMDDDTQLLRCYGRVRRWPFSAFYRTSNLDRESNSTHRAYREYPARYPSKFNPRPKQIRRPWEGVGLYSGRIYNFTNLGKTEESSSGHLA